VDLLWTTEVHTKFDGLKGLERGRYIRIPINMALTSCTLYYRQSKSPWTRGADPAGLTHLHF
jgi:hypothetical protein